MSNLKQATGSKRKQSALIIQTLQKQPLSCLLKYNSIRTPYRLNNQAKPEALQPLNIFAAANYNNFGPIQTNLRQSTKTSKGNLLDNRGLSRNIKICYSGLNEESSITKLSESANNLWRTKKILHHAKSGTKDDKNRKSIVSKLIVLQ